MSVKLVFLTLLFQCSFAVSGMAGEVDNSCKFLKQMAILVQVGTDQRATGPMKEAYRFLCVMPFKEGTTIHYLNGQLATYEAKRQGTNWYYPNGQVITAGNSYSTWYYPNGKEIASSAAPGYTIRYPNGKNATSTYGQKNATWYYENGQVITYIAGEVGSTWYYSNGRQISSSMGHGGATWYAPDGSVMISNGPELSEDALVNVPEILALVLGIETSQ